MSIDRKYAKQTVPQDNGRQNRSDRKVQSLINGGPVLSPRTCGAEECGKEECMSSQRKSKSSKSSNQRRSVQSSPQKGGTENLKTKQPSMNSRLPPRGGENTSSRSKPFRSSTLRTPCQRKLQFKWYSPTKRMSQGQRQRVEA